MINLDITQKQQAESGYFYSICFLKFYDKSICSREDDLRKDDVKANAERLKIQQNMLDFLTDDKELQHEISKLLYIIPAEQKNYNK